MPDFSHLSALAELQELYRLLLLEYEYEKESYQLKSQAGGIYKKIQQGYCCYPVRAGRNYYNSLNVQVIEIEYTQDEETEHAFEHGKPVCFFSPDANGRQRYFNFTGTVSYIQENRMVILLPGMSAVTALRGCSDLGIQLYFDETTFQAMFKALNEVMRAKGNRLAELRDILLGKQTARKRTFFPVRFPWLNLQQEEAVNRVLSARETAVVHGPPGTGKTTTLVEAIYETLHQENQVLVCAQSNTAVDWIAEKLSDRGIPVLRIGNPSRVNDKMLSFTYERRFEAHADYPELWSIRKIIRETVTKLRKNQSSTGENLRNKLCRLREQATGLEIKIDQDLFAEARVISCTLVGSANRVLERKRFSTLFIDEASQALEAACWIAIAKADRVILAGDHCQLPPTVKCPEAAKAGLTDTLMQKIAERQPETVSLLETQYRMHEDIMTFPSCWFYHNRLKAAPEVKHREILPYDTPVVWCDTAGYESREALQSEKFSRFNETEARLLIEQLQNYIEKIGETRIWDEQIDFGLISPYQAQVQYIRRLLKHNRFLKPFRSRIAVHTVDGFQGQEKDVILISLVRANPEGQIGFLNDLRRMNVAITRARMKLIVLGDSSTLTHHPFYRTFYEYVSRKGKVISRSLPE